MDLHGQNLIGGKPSAEGKKTFTGVNPATNETLSPSFTEATAGEADQALALAERDFEAFRQQPPEKIAELLERIAEEINALGDELIKRAQAETALPEPRLVGERARTVNQLRMFADLIREGSWTEARIDRAMPDRKPLPKPDLRRKLIPIGPVVVFSASNFPLAFSVAGGDTASALAAGNPVVVKAHRAHPGLSEMVGRAIQLAIERTQMPRGIFSLLHGAGRELGMQLVRHRATRAVGFTGSLQAGRALFDAAAARLDPIPVYAEMGSTNPVFVLPGALKKNGPAIAEGFVQSVTLGVGQFCTNPGLVLGLNSPELRGFAEKAGQLAANVAPGTMLSRAMSERFEEGLEQARKVPGVTVSGQSSAAAKAGQAPAVILSVEGAVFVQREVLHEEIFGPSSIIVNCASRDEMEKIARALPGQLTATIHGTEEDLASHRVLIDILQQRAGRLLFNGFPTGVEVCPSMHHGGPYPAMTIPQFTSVGTAAIQRFARPVCFQNFPDGALPPELQNQNPRKIWRLVDGKFTQEPV